MKEPIAINKKQLVKFESAAHAYRKWPFSMKEQKREREQERGLEEVIFELILNFLEVNITFIF